MLKSLLLGRCLSHVMSHSPRLASTKVESLFEFENSDIDSKQIREKFMLYSDGPILWERMPRGNRKKTATTKDYKAVKDILDKYKIPSFGLSMESKLVVERAWRVERKIMLLQEMGVPEIKQSSLENFSRGFYATPLVFKKIMNVDVNTNIIRNMLSHVKKFDIDYRTISTYDDECAPIQRSYVTCLNAYVRLELELTREECDSLCMGYEREIVNSFRLLGRMFEFCRNKLGFDNADLKKNLWLLRHHPAQGQKVHEILFDEYGDVSFEYFKRWPKILTAHPDDVELSLKFLKEFEITSEMIKCAPLIFLINPWELRKRIQNLLANPYTQFYRHHPRFLKLASNYYSLQPRIAFLKEKNLDYGTINSLITFHNPVAQLTTKKRLTRLNMVSFFKTNFEGDFDEVISNFKKHPMWSYASLVTMLESLGYLRERFSESAVRANVYAILYHKNDIDAAYKNIKSDPNYSHLTDSQLLSLCIYKVEQMFHFTGEGVLSPRRYAEQQQDGDRSGSDKQQHQPEKAEAQPDQLAAEDRSDKQDEKIEAPRDHSETKDEVASRSGVEEVGDAMRNK